MRQFLLITWIAGILCCLSNTASAGIDNPVIQTLKGSLSQITAGASMTVEDAKFFDPAYYGKLAKPYTLKSIIAVEIDEDLRLLMPSSFSATIRLRLTYLKNDSTTTTVEDRDFAVNYDAGGNYAHRNTYYIDNAVRVKVEVLSLTPSSGTQYGFLKVVNYLQSYPQYNFNCTNNAVQAVYDSAWAANTDKDELPVYWSPVIGADEYDLEWTYVDDSVLASGYYGTAGSYNADKIFENNASRVTITGTIYNIPVIYDNNGVLFYRVRSVQWQLGGGRNEANWSSTFGSGGLGEWDFDGHERPLNWQATTTFAEDGKRKTVVQYYDGSLRARQTVTKDNTTNRTIVAESFYDYQGRPVIQVLPAPTLSNIIKYNQGFNTGVNAAIYDKHEYDTLSDPSFYCNSGASPMDTLSGASQYYSPNNPLRDSGFHKYIPDAKRYPFTEVEYTQDNTGRISRQSGVGAEYKIGSGHETKYFYGTADQRELDALFGTEVGDASHYFKTMVRDANGQYSVSYTDMRGRTIATALAGVPDSVKLDTLSSYSAFERTEALTTPQSTVIKDLVMESKKSLLVAKAGFHSFTYKLDPLSLQQEGCDEVNICYECLYDLRITITDDCNNQKLPDGKPFDTVVHNFSIGNIDTSCTTNSGGYNVTFVKWLEKGNYEITKQLAVSSAALEYYRDSIFLAANTCKTLDTFVQQQRAIMASIQQCAPTCQSCLDSLGDWNSYWLRFRQRSGIADQDTADYKQMAYEAYQTDSLSCQELCGNTTELHDIRKAMLMDMTPSSGQYANLDKAEDNWSVFYDDQDGKTPDTTAKYRLVTNYRDENGNMDMVFDEGAGILVAPQKLSPEMFAQKFKNSWAESLLQYHPEYCKLLKYEELNYSHAWDRRFESVDTWSEAKQKGYLNPTGALTLPFSSFAGTGTLDSDPLAGFMGGQLNDSIAKYRFIGSPYNYYVSMWSMATMSVMCSKDDNACYNKYRLVANAFNTDSLCEAELNMAWRSFRQMYLDVKRKLLNGYIKSQCNGSKTAAQIIAAGYAPHFSDADELSTAKNAGLPPDKNQASNIAKDRINANAINTCQAYAFQWWQQLKPCATQFISPGDSARIISRLVAICQEGSDINHPYGASSVKPSSVYPYRSFEAFFEHYCDSMGYNINAVCNPYLITAPKPYDQQVAYNNKPVYRPDSCECNTISKYYIKYQAAPSFGSFSNYLKQVYKTNLSDSVLSLLLNMCSIGGGSPANCTWFTDIVSLPPIFQCYTGDVCVNCDVFKTLDSTFRSKYPGVHPLAVDSVITDSAQLAANSMYEQYMNHKLGFTKTTADYFAFAGQCQIGWSGTSCDSLQQLVVDYKALYNANYGVIVKYNLYGGPTISDYHQTFHNGVFQLPDSIRQQPPSWYNEIEVLAKGGYRFCWSDGYGVEMRMRYLSGDFTGYFGDLFYMTTGNFNCLFAKYSTGFYLVNVTDNHGNSYGTQYGGTGFDSILVASGSTALKNWFTVKLQVSPSHYYIYFNGALAFDVARNPALSIGEVPNYQVGSKGRQLAVDWIRLYDAPGQVRYFEDFPDPDNPVKPDANYICPEPYPNCQTGFVSYYNTQRGTSYTYSQIDSVYQANCGKPLNPCPDTLANRLEYLKKDFNNLYYNHGIRYDENGCDTSTWKVDYGPAINQTGVPHNEIFSNGVMHFPDTLGIPPIAPLGVDYDFKWLDTACVEGHFSIEWRMRFPQYNSKLITELWFNSHEPDQVAKNYITIEPQYIRYNSASFFNWVPGGPGGSEDSVAEFVQDYTYWRVLKFEIDQNLLKFYLDGVLLKTFTFDPGVYVSKFYGLGLLSSNATPHKSAEFDWIKAYDKNGRLFYQEDFNNCGVFSYFAPFIRCPKQPCDQAFTTYYNQKQGTSYSYSQIDSLYTANNVDLSVCNVSNSNVTLCGRAEPVFPPITDAPIDNCSDTSFFIASKAQELKKVYDDSLKHYFDSSYIAKCMQAYKLESFTVRHAVSEYHYTLYYYDQAGNLVKTIPPAGVQPNYDSLWLDSVAAARIAGAFKVPAHQLPTQYRYNTLNQVKSQKTPDGGKTDFWYDRLGRLVLSRNARQLAMSSAASNYFSYTRYDTLGRITEVGQIKDTSAVMPITDLFTRNEASLINWFNKNNYYREQVTNTVYDIPFFTTTYNSQWVAQKNLRNRVSYVSYTETTGMASGYNNATFYSYDIHGNVDTLVQDYGCGNCGNSLVYNVMNRNGNRWKKFIYQYDLISGKVNQVMYQKGWADQWFHRYSYDAENRLTLAETSLDSMIWERDARYEYYLHGPLARTTLGDQQVQGMDYAYTLQGWLKGINSTGGTITHDIGGDGSSGQIHQYTATDALCLTLNYFEGEYKPISYNVDPFPAYKTNLVSNGTYRPLYNGNISSMSTYLRIMEGGASTPSNPLLFNNYRYDQLNRLTGQEVYNGFNSGGNSWTLAMLSDSSYRERISYDGNGNILTYRRNGNKAGTDRLMDDMTYTYYSGTNRLRRIRDAVSAGRYGTGSFDMDMDDQSNANNYVYDDIGNMISDAGEQISSIKWNVYGKITEIIRTSTGPVPLDTIRYTYDVQGNRISKLKRLGGKWKYTWYVRDAKGNVTATYDDDDGHANGYLADVASVNLALSERYIYGSSRLGMTAVSNGVDNGNNGPNSTQFYSGSQFFRGWRRYELTNHLGNVLTTISDKKFGVSFGGVGSLIDYYNPDLKSGQDFYPFGMLMPGRFPLGGAPYYKYTFNGKENDWEAKGWNDQIDYGMRIYDPRLGRFLSMDPRQTQFPDLTPYQFAGNTPIQAIDLDGLEPQGFMDYWEARTEPYMTRWNYTVQDFYDYKTNQVWTVMNYPNTDEYFFWEPKYEQAEKLFKPYNTSLNRLNGTIWSGKFKQFKPTHLSEDRSFHYLMSGIVVGVPGLVIYGKAIATYLFSELLEEAAGVTIPDGPVDFWKQQMKKKAEREITEEMSEEVLENIDDIPSGSRLPVSNGKWDGEVGNSGWQSTKAEVNAVTKGKAVPFKNGYPDFSEWSIGSLNVKGMTGDNNIDFPKAYQKMMEELNFPTQKAAKDWLKANKLTLHHHQDGVTLQMVPTDLHKNIYHEGGASRLRNQ